MKKLIYITVFACLFFLSCSKDSQEDLLEPINSGETITYTEHIQSIISSNCNSCHSDPPVNGASIPLVTYDQVVNAVNNSGLINRIARQTGEAGAMPLGGPRLPQNLIDLVIQWQTDGLLEN